MCFLYGKDSSTEQSCSVSINHLALNEIDIGDYRTFAKLDPPLREESDRQSLLKAVNDGTIDVIVSCPSAWWPLCFVFTPTVVIVSSLSVSC